MRGWAAVTRIFGLGPRNVLTVTTAPADREILRHAAFQTLARLETKRAKTGRLDVDGPESRQAFADAAYFLIQARRCSGAATRSCAPFLVAANARVFVAAPVLPQGIDLDGMVRGQMGFSTVIHEQLRAPRMA
jgi:hypothetical protein